MTTSKELMDLTLEYSAHNYAPLPVVLRSGHGVWVTDVEGKRYLDMLSAYSGLNFGHCHPRLIKAAHEQLEKLTLTSRAFYSEEFALLCQELSNLCGKEQSLIMNSGAEAVETAIKAARKWGYDVKGVPEGKAEIVVLSDNFHGRTTTIVSFSTSELSRKGFAPYTPGFVVVPYGDSDAIAKVINNNTVAVLVEPVLGEGGVIIPPPGFLKEVRRITEEHNVLFIADEIQSGLYRTAKLFASEHEGVIPDAYILGKSLGGGIVPISAFVADKSVMDVFTPGTHGSTFGGNPFACRIAREVVAMLREEDWAGNVSALGDHLVKAISDSGAAMVTGIRGRGLFVGVDIDPGWGKAKKMCEKLCLKGVLSKDTRDQTIRFAPPLTITKEELEIGIALIKEAFAG